MPSWQFSGFGLLKDWGAAFAVLGSDIALLIYTQFRAQGFIQSGDTSRGRDKSCTKS